jgi:hypothetical protein
VTVNLTDNGWKTCFLTTALSSLLAFLFPFYSFLHVGLGIPLSNLRKPYLAFVALQFLTLPLFKVSRDRLNALGERKYLDWTVASFSFGACAGMFYFGKASGYLAPEFTNLGYCVSFLVVVLFLFVSKAMHRLNLY